MRVTTARRPSSIFLHQAGHAQATGRLGAACAARRMRPGQPAAAPRSAPSESLRGVRLLVVEDNALNRQVAAELLSSEGARWPSPTAGLAGVQQVLEASVPFDAVLMDMQMPISMVSRRPGESAPTLRRAADCYDRQRLAGRPRLAPRWRA